MGLGVNMSDFTQLSPNQTSTFIVIPAPAVPPFCSLSQDAECSEQLSHQRSPARALNKALPDPVHLLLDARPQLGAEEEDERLLAFFYRHGCGHLLPAILRREREKGSHVG